jgi:hypothetical protein
MVLGGAPPATSPNRANHEVSHHAKQRDEEIAANAMGGN